jgi:hypothetical protein
VANLWPARQSSRCRGAPVFRACRASSSMSAMGMSHASSRCYVSRMSLEDVSEPRLTAREQAIFKLMARATRTKKSPTCSSSEVEWCGRWWGESRRSCSSAGDRNWRGGMRTMNDDLDP